MEARSFWPPAFARKAGYHEGQGRPGAIDRKLWTHRITRRFRAIPICSSFGIERYLVPESEPVLDHKRHVSTKGTALPKQSPSEDGSLVEKTGSLSVRFGMIARSGEP
jgi:hypothetical protein